ncbi:hypothetical protein [Pyruvatibacter sp.]|uniref:hypothetical protein n=1 Tax=Pyruvatibacter sp. TaxID=1981328 RepID=UPI0032EDD442
MTRLYRSIILGAAIGLLAAGCAHEADRDLSHLPGFTAGYTDGCRTAHNRERGFATKVLRDEDMFAQDAAYRAGWRDGSMTCGSSDGLGRNRMFEDQQIGPAPL